LTESNVTKTEADGLFGYLNPWLDHSPSFRLNVQTHLVLEFGTQELGSCCIDPLIFLVTKILKLYPSVCAIDTRNVFEGFVLNP
jgi:hypothetical protein